MNTMEEMMKMMGEMSDDEKSEMMRNMMQGCCLKIDTSKESMQSVCQSMFEKLEKQFSTQKTKG